MNSIFKKVVSLVIALVIMLSTTISVGDVFAEGTDNTKTEKGSITVTGAKEGKTYGVYRIFDLTYADNEGGKSKSVSYTINSDWESFFKGKGAGAKYIVDSNNKEGNLNPITVDGNVKYINITDKNVAEFAKDAMGELSNKTRVNTAKESNGSVNFKDLPLGYYLVHPQGATEKARGENSIVSLTSTTPNAEIKSKGEYPTLTKKVDKKSQDIGGEVTFTIKTKVPDTTGYSSYSFEVKDTLPTGLDYVQNSMNVKVGKSNNVNYSSNYNNKILTISFTKDQLKDHANQELTITYKAKINKDAKIGNEGNENKALLEYSNDPKETKSKETTPESKVKVYTGKITVTKVDAKEKTKKLSGAEFVLYKLDGKNKKYFKQTLNTKDNKVEKVEWVDSEENATKLTTGKDGTIKFEGLAAGTYSIHETKAPKGYNLLTKDTEVKLSHDDTKNDQNQTPNLKMEATSEIENSTGVELPTTGGNGTKLFALIGGAVILGTVSSLLRGKIKSERR